MAKQKPTKAEQSHMAKIASMPCILCEALGERQTSKTDVHHLRDGEGMSQRASHWLTIPLCHDTCHQGKAGRHGDQTLYRIAKVSDMDLLALTIEKLSRAT